MVQRRFKIYSIKQLLSDDILVSLERTKNPTAQLECAPLTNLNYGRNIKLRCTCPNNRFGELQNTRGMITKIFGLEDAVFDGGMATPSVGLEINTYTGVTNTTNYHLIAFKMLLFYTDSICTIVPVIPFRFSSCVLEVKLPGIMPPPGGNSARIVALVHLNTSPLRIWRQPNVWPPNAHTVCRTEVFPKTCIMLEVPRQRNKLDA